MESGQNTDILEIVIPSTDRFFLVVVGLHVLAALGCVVFGLAAMLLTKGRGRHSAAGTIYFWAMGAVFATVAVLAVMRWAQEHVLFLLGTLAFTLVSLGRLAVIRGWGLRYHAIFMGTSYIVLLTAFYVDNGKNLPVWKELPTTAYWTIPALVGVPLILRSVARYRLLRSNRVTISN
jgi:uncharacterized membrane protein